MTYHIDIDTGTVRWTDLSITRIYLVEWLAHLKCDYQTEYKLGIL